MAASPQFVLILESERYVSRRIRYLLGGDDIQGTEYDVQKEVFYRALVQAVCGESPDGDHLDVWIYLVAWLLLPRSSNFGVAPSCCSPLAERLSRLWHGRVVLYETNDLLMLPFAVTFERG